MSFNFHGFGTVLIQIFTRWPLGLKVQIFHQIFYAPWPDRKSASNWIFFSKNLRLRCCCYWLLTANPPPTRHRSVHGKKQTENLQRCLLLPIIPKRWILLLSRVQAPLQARSCLSDFNEKLYKSAFTLEKWHPFSRWSGDLYWWHWPFTVQW